MKVAREGPSGGSGCVKLVEIRDLMNDGDDVEEFCGRCLLLKL